MLTMQSKIPDSDKPSILINGAHHARELTSISMVVYTTLRLLHGYLDKKDVIIDLLTISEVFLVPAINIDGFKYICDHHSTDRPWDFEYIRKNRHIYPQQEYCPPEA